MRFSRTTRIAALGLGLAVACGCEDSGGPQGAPTTSNKSTPPATAPATPETVKTAGGKTLKGNQPEAPPG